MKYLDAKIFQQIELIQLVAHLLVFTASLSLFFLPEGVSRLRVFGIPAVSFYLSFCFVLYLVITVAAYLMVFSHWRAKDICGDEECI